MPDIGLHIPGAPETEFADWTERAERNGFDSVWITSGIHNIDDSSTTDIPVVSHDPFLQLYECARRTTDIDLAIAILPIYGQSAVVAAQTIASLDVRSDGRAILGVGVGHPKIIERAHNKTIDKPVERLQTFSETIQQLTTQDPATRDRDLPKHVDATIDFPLTSATIPVYVAALGPRNVRAIGAYADGWLPNLFPRTMLETAIETVKSVSKEHGRHRDAVTVAPQILAYVDDGSGTAERRLRRNIADKIVYQPFYANLLSGTGYEDAVNTACDRWSGDNLNDVAAELPVEMVRDVGVAGTPETVRERIDEYRAIGADRPILFPRNADEDGIERVVTEVIPEG